MPAAWIDDQPLRIEAAPEHRRVVIEQERIEAIQSPWPIDRSRGRSEQTLRIPEDDRFLDSEAGDGSRDRLYPQRKPLESCCVIDQAAARSAVRKRPPFVPNRIVVQVGKHPQPTGVGARLLRGI